MNKIHSLTRKLRKIPQEVKEDTLQEPFAMSDEAKQDPLEAHYERNLREYYCKKLPNTFDKFKILYNGSLIEVVEPQRFIYLIEG